MEYVLAAIGVIVVGTAFAFCAVMVDIRKILKRGKK